MADNLFRLAGAVHRLSSWNCKKEEEKRKIFFSAQFSCSNLSPQESPLALNPVCPAPCWFAFCLLINNLAAQAADDFKML